MTIEQFDKIGFTGGMFCLYKGKKFEIASVDFEERLIGIQEFERFDSEDYQLDWKRCENIELL